MNIKENTQLGNYTVIRKLGSGGMADVFLAYDNKLGREVAIKVLPPEFTREPESLARFEKEIKATAQLQHPGLVSIYEMCECKLDGIKLNFFSMNYLSGGELKDKIIEGLNEKEALDIFLQLAEALGHAHDNNLIHRDIKPQNVLFNNLGKPVISDLGIAKSTNLDETIVSNAGLSVGTPYYMSPEQALGETDVDFRSDIYALGILLHEMLTGEIPYSGNSGMAVAIKHIQEPIPVLPKQFNHLQPILDKCLAKKKESRYTNTKELIEDVVKFHCESTNTKDKSNTVNNKHKEIKLTITAIFCLTVLLIGVIGYSNKMWFFGNSEIDLTSKNNQTETENNPIPQQKTVSVKKEPEQTKQEYLKLQITEQEKIEQEKINQQNIKIQKLVVATKLDIEELRLTKPDNNNAFNKIEKIKQISPNHQQVLTLTQLVETKYVELINSALSRNKFDSVRTYLTILSEISVDKELLIELNRDLKKSLNQYRIAFTKAHVGKLITLPSGEFNMGSRVIKEKVVINETPLHLVKIKEFKLAKHEVTVGQFRKFIDKTGYITLAEMENEGCYTYSKTWTEIKGYHWSKPGFSQKEDHPVVCISFIDAMAYIKWLNKESGLMFRLPSESEWEYASRSGKSFLYGFGDSIDQLCSHANFADDPDIINESSNKLSLSIFTRSDCRDGVFASTASVDSYKANSFGLVDMHGNASEWTQDCWNSDYLGAPINGSAWLDGRCDLRVIRGGSWMSDAKNVRSAVRNKNVKYSRDNVTGFRLAIDIEKP